VELGADGNLVMEWALLERILHLSFVRDSNDPFWCSVHHYHNLFLQCLDVAAPSTLKGFVDRSYAGWMSMYPSMANVSQVFGQSQKCDNVTQGDGALTTADMHIYMAYQFRSHSHDHLTRIPWQVHTVQPRVGTTSMCGNGLSRTYYWYGFWGTLEHGQCVECQTIDAPPGLCANEHASIDSTPHDLFGRRLLSRHSQSTAHDDSVALPSSKRRLLTDGSWHLPPLYIHIEVWAGMRQGVWYRIQTSGVHLALELNLIGVDADRVPLSTRPAPSKGESVPPDDETHYQLRFKRHHEYYTERDAEQCASVYSSMSPLSAISFNVLGVSQRIMRNQRACAFDLFLWFPATQALSVDSRRVLHTRACSFGVQAGSTSVDGTGGQMLHHDSCVQDNSPSSPPPGLLPTGAPHPPSNPPRARVAPRVPWFAILLPTLIVSAVLVHMAWMSRVSGRLVLSGVQVVSSTLEDLRAGRTNDTVRVISSATVQPPIAP
jgi:hypothetical protein